MGETHKASAFRRRAERSVPRDFSDSGESLDGEFFVVFLDVRAPDLFEIINGGAQSDCACDIWCAGFKSCGGRLVSGGLVFDGEDHFAASLPRGHLGEALGLSIKHSDSGWGAHLVS